MHSKNLITKEIMIAITENKGKKKPHFVSEVRIFRQYERGVLVSNCQVLFPLGIDTANIRTKHIQSKDFYE